MRGQDQRRIGYLDPFSGASGDMLVAGLVGVGVNLDHLNRALAGLGLGIHLKARDVMRAGVAATKVDVQVGDGPAEDDHAHPHRGLKEIDAILLEAQLHPTTREGARAVFQSLARAEGSIHGMPPERVHFHEVGALDAIADVVAVVEGVRLLDLEELWCGPLPMSAGMTRSAHGRIPLPAPATLELLTGFPVQAGPGRMEMVTPTGAALLRHLTRPAPSWPSLTPERIGYGAGSKDTEHPNILRLIVGNALDDGGWQSWDGMKVAQALGLEWGQCLLLECNIDDMNPQLFGHVQQRLFSAGALDVFFTPVYMKKQRPGTLLSVLAVPERASFLIALLIQETTTIGVRARQVDRWMCRREVVPVQTPYGPIGMKVARAGTAIVNVLPEYDDCVRAAQAGQVPVKTVQQAAIAAWEGQKVSGTES